MHIICIMGKSGSGKSTLEKRLESLGYNRIISYTTREKRGNEQNGVEYHFITKEQFKQLLHKDILMEHAIYNGNYYGAPKPVGSSNNVIVVETDGFKTIKQLYGKQAVGVYIDISDAELKKRLNTRGDTDYKTIESRHIEDKQKFADIEDKADIILRDEPLDIMVLKVLDYVRKLEGGNG